jgi:c-di-GMP-binding flagellar brake protein YcgR
LGWFFKDDSGLQERRRHRRLRANYQALYLLPNNRPISVEILDISPLGFRMAAPVSLPLRTSSRLRVEKGRRVLEVPMELLWQRKRKMGTMEWVYGGRFVDLSERNRRDVAHCICGDATALEPELRQARKHVRIELKTLVANDQFELTDISEGGVGLLTDTEIPPDTLISFRLGLGRTPFECQARVTHCRLSKDRSYYSLGLAFQDLDDRQRAALRRIIARLTQSKA